MDPPKGLPILVVAAIAAKRELCLGHDRRQRSPELVGELGGERCSWRRLDASRASIGRRSPRAGELVMGLADIEAVVEIVFAPGRRLRGHLGRRDEGPASTTSRVAITTRRERRRRRSGSEEGRRRGVLVRLERDGRRRPFRASAPLRSARRTAGCRWSALGVAPWTPGQLVGRPGRRRSRAGAPGLAAAVHPDLGVGGAPVRGLDRAGPRPDLDRSRAAEARAGRTRSASGAGSGGAAG